MFILFYFYKLKVVNEFPKHRIKPKSLAVFTSACVWNFFFTKKKKYYCYCYAMQQSLPPVSVKESPWIAQISIDFSFTTIEATHSRFWWQLIVVDSMHQTSLSGPKDKRKMSLQWFSKRECGKGYQAQLSRTSACSFGDGISGISWQHQCLPLQLGLKWRG